MISLYLRLYLNNGYTNKFIVASARPKTVVEALMRTIAELKIHVYNLSVTKTLINNKEAWKVSYGDTLASFLITEAIFKEKE